MMEFEVRHWMSNSEAGIEDRGHNGIGNLFYGSKGYLAVDSYVSYKSWLGREQAPGPARREGGDHFANWLEAIRTPQAGNPALLKSKKARFRPR